MNNKPESVESPPPLTPEEIRNSPTLKRLIEEVRQEQRDGVHAYNRTYTRHNRS